FAAQDEVHGVAWQVDSPPAGVWAPFATRAGPPDAVGAYVDRPYGGQGIDVVVGAELEAGVLRVAVDSHPTARAPQARGELDQLAARHVVHGQLALFLGEGLLILPVPADRYAVPAQDGAFFGREKALVLLIGPVGAVPKVGGLSVAVANAVEAVENPPVMWGMDLGIVRPSVGNDAVAARRIEVMEHLIGTDATGGGGLV